MSITTSDVRNWILQEQTLASDQGSLRIELKSSRVYSRVFQAHVPGFAAPLAIKVCLDAERREAVPAAAELQYAALKKVHGAAMRSGGYRSLQPYPLLLQRGCVVTRWENGETLRRRIAWWRQPLCRALPDVAASAAWLRGFHRSGESGRGTLDTRKMMGQLSASLDEASAAFRGSSPVLRSFELLSHTSPLAAQFEFPMTWLHGDFKADNVIIVGAEAIALDIQLKAFHIGLHDVANFLVDLDLCSLEPSTVRLPKSRQMIEQAFLAAYFGPSEPRSLFPLAWARLHLALTIWAARERRRELDPRLVFMRARLKMLTKRLLLALEVQQADHVRP